MVERGNTLAAIAEPFVAEIEGIETDMESRKGVYMAEIKKMRSQRKEVYSAAKDAGVPVRPLKGIVKTRRLERKIQAIPAELDLEEQAAYRELAEGALGPLGQAAARAAGFEPVQEGEDDVRPRHMRERDRQREGEAALAKVGRGPADPVETARG